LGKALQPMDVRFLSAFEVKRTLATTASVADEDPKRT